LCRSKDEISAEVLNTAAIFVLACPRTSLAEAEIEALHEYVNQGGSLLVLTGEGGDKANDTNLNALTEPLGIRINTDVVLRASYHQHPHPKECIVSGGVVDEGLQQAASRLSRRGGLDFV